MSEEEYQQVAVFPSLPKTTRGMPAVLGASPNGDKILYCNGNSVYTVPLNNLTGAEIYTEHSVPTTVAKMSPSGYYCASGDQNGNVRIWDTTQSTHILKAQYQVFSGPVRDIAWNDDSKRIAAVGEGKERFGHVFLFDTGTSNGNLSGQSRPMSSVDFKPTRPYRIVSGSEDNTVALFEGPPFKFKTTMHDHSRFVHVTRYNKSGTMFASAGADGKVFLFDGTDGSKIGELADESCKNAAHSGSVFGLSWSPCDKKIATSSGDKSVKIWNVEEKTLEKTISFGTTIDDQQLSVIWTKSALVSLSLSGYLNVINTELGTVEECRQGHNKPITALHLTKDKKYLFTSDFEGNTTRWDVATGASMRLKPSIHKSQIAGLSMTDNNELISVGYDDVLKVTKVDDENIEATKSVSTTLPSQPFDLAVSNDGSLTVVACYKHILVQKSGETAKNIGINYTSSCCDISPCNQIIAVGGQDGKVHIYKSDSMQETTFLQHTGAITAISFSDDGSHLAVTDAQRKVVPYKLQGDDFIKASTKEWTFHTAKVNCVAWSPDGNRLATGAIDTNIIVWDLSKSGDHPLIIKGAHAMSQINGLAWIDEKTLVSAGQDANVKKWTINA